MIKLNWKLREKMQEMASRLNMLRNLPVSLNSVIVSQLSLLLIVCVLCCAFYSLLIQYSHSTPMTFPRNSLFSSGLSDTNGRIQRSTPSLLEESDMLSSIPLPSKSEQSSQESGRVNKNGPVSNGRRRWQR